MTQAERARFVDRVREIHNAADRALTNPAGLHQVKILAAQLAADVQEKV